MTVFVCLDDRGGMTFNKRRQSRDSAVVQDIFRTLNESRLWISPFSEKYVPEGAVKVSKNPLKDAGEQDFCFIENVGISDYLEKIDTIIIYKWNEIYPSDFKFDIKPEECGFRFRGKYDFVGKAHKKITKEVYKK